MMGYNLYSMTCDTASCTVLSWQTYLMKGLPSQQVKECLFLSVDSVEMGPMVEECLYHCRFGWLVQSSGMKGGVAILNTDINNIY